MFSQSWVTPDQINSQGENKMTTYGKVRYETVNTGRLDLGTLIGFFFAGVALIAMWSTNLQANMQTTHKGQIAFVEIKKEIKKAEEGKREKIEEGDVKEKEVVEKEIIKENKEVKAVTNGNTYRKIILTAEPIPELQYTRREIYLEIEPLEERVALYRKK
jgi:hypothetical protein